MHGCTIRMDLKTACSNYTSTSHNQPSCELCTFMLHGQSTCSDQHTSADASKAPAEGRQIILDATRDAFLEGMHSGVRVAAVATAIGAVAALVFLPAKGVDLNAAPPADQPVTT